MSTQTNETGGVLAVWDKAYTAVLCMNGSTDKPDEALERGIVEARAAVARAFSERDALREVLREFQDGRRYSNPHTRQVAHDIEQAALARVGGA